MSEIAGISTLADRMFPSGVDSTRLAEFRFADGLTYRDLVNRCALALNAANMAMEMQWGFLYSYTNEIMAEYANGGSVSAMPEISDDMRPRPVKGETIGHMYDWKNYGSAIAGTRHSWKRKSVKRLTADIGVIVKQGIWRFEQVLLNRLFVNTEYAVGSAGYNVPFVRSSGSVAFIPMAYDGLSFDSTHNHFLGFDSGSKTLANVLDDLAATLEHHGHKAPFTAIVSRDDKATYNGLTNIVKFVQVPNLIIGNTSAGPQLIQQRDLEFGHFADYQSPSGIVHLIASSRVPTGFAQMHKSYGQLDARNPLAVFLWPGDSFGMQIVPQTSMDDEVPIQQLDVEFSFGVGVGEDRTNGATGKLVSGGTYGNPSIS